MRKVAAHRVFWALNNEWRSMGVVEIDDSGTVCGWASLHEEQRATEWLGGVIVIASKRPERLSEESFSDYCNRLYREESVLQETSLQAYHITQFDIAGMRFTPASRIVRL